jgi:6-phosphogluconolactonase
VVIRHQGASGKNPRRQEAPHAHSVDLDAEDRYAFAADLGADKVMIYRFDGQRGSLAAAEPPFAALAAGAGTRHIALHPSGRYLYVVNELNSTVTAFAREDGTPRLTELQTIATLPADFRGVNHPAEVAIHPSGRFLYASNRGQDAIAVFAIDGDTGRLTGRGHVPTGGKNPRQFAIHPSGKYLLVANQDSDSVVSFRVDPATGGLKATGHRALVPKPVCVLVTPASASRRE